MRGFSSPRGCSIGFEPSLSTDEVPHQSVRPSKTDIGYELPLSTDESPHEAVQLSQDVYMHSLGAHVPNDELDAEKRTHKRVRIGMADHVNQPTGSGRAVNDTAANCSFERISEELRRAFHEELVAMQASIFDHVTSHCLEILEHVGATRTQVSWQAPNSSQHKALVETSDSYSDSPTPSGFDLSKLRKSSHCMEQEKVNSQHQYQYENVPVLYQLEKMMLFWHSIQEPERVGLLARVVLSVQMEIFFGVVVFLNTVFAVARVNHTAANVLSRSEEPDVYRWFELAFALTFLIELGLKLLVHRQYLFVNGNLMWNWLDVFLVLGNIADFIAKYFKSAFFVENSDVARVVRFVRLLKMARLIRVMRRSVDLRTMIDSLFNSTVCLFWSIVMLGFICFAFGLIFVHIATMHIADSGKGDDERVLFYFGSVEGAMFTLYQATTGGVDWIEPYNAIAVTGTFCKCLFTFFVAFVQVAVLNLVTGLFVNTAMSFAEPTNVELAALIRGHEYNVFKFLSGPFKEHLPLCEVNGVSLRDFEFALDKDEVRSELFALGLSVRDAATFFEALLGDSDGGRIPYPVFVEACLSLRGVGSTLDVQVLSFDMNVHFERLRKSLDAILQQIKQIQSPYESVSLLSPPSSKSHI
eukprot:TRINITY_DN16758_c0_g1_i7.p1 TRINITY_DN16758_c0_g1~~TRINITY_DN16758_c0_g1_i7.p1  ORF type:complete len:640 (+),score=88.20 TRINITY_DN16758_c0_g1_i7:187-2106(+)